MSPSSKTWWDLVKSVSGVCFPSIPSLSSNGTTADSTHEKAECLNSVCASKSCVPNPSLSVPILCCQTQLILDSVSFAPEKVEKVLSTLDSDFVTGLDSIISHVLKTCSAAPAHPLSALFTSSFVLCHLPYAWNFANITVLYKNNEQSKILLRIRARRRAISRSTLMAAESPTGRTILTRPFPEQRRKPTADRDLTLPLLVRGLSVRDRVNRPKSIHL